MQRLVQGVHFFQDVGFEPHSQLFERLSHSQTPEACLITCCDSRIVPHLITHSDPGQLFIVRNVGNIVPCFGTANNGELAAVEYAVAALQVKDIIICGHTNCGAMQALNDLPNCQEKFPSVASWLQHAEATLSIVREYYPDLKGDELTNVMAQENVLVQLEHLRTLPAIASQLARGQIRLHGWMYKIQTGEIFQYDAKAEQFVKFSHLPEPHLQRLLAVTPN